MATCMLRQRSRHGKVPGNITTSAEDSVGYNARFEGLTATATNIPTVWDVRPCEMTSVDAADETCCVYFHGSGAACKLRPAV
jgi:hypothetical protein